MNEDNEMNALREDEKEIAAKKAEIRDLEVKNASIIFQSVWMDLVAKVGQNDKVIFPKEIFWLNGAPGAGKGTHTRFIMDYRGLTVPPIVVSDLLQSPEAKQKIDAGLLVGDKEVIQLVFNKLLEDQFKNGAIVDGFPRTKVQVECLKLLYNKLIELRSIMIDRKEKRLIPKPQFHIIVLFVDEQESVRRQLGRGKRALLHNEKVKESGIGELLEVRKTDLDRDAALNRYRTFKEKTYESLQSLQEIFHYHYINAVGKLDEVQRDIIKELKYQSSLELDQSTYDRVIGIPLASSLGKHARQELVSRLDEYEMRNTELFKKVTEVIQEKFIPIIKRHAISGVAQVNTEEDVFDDPLAIAMLIDIFSERGYHVMVDIKKQRIPKKIDPKTYAIEVEIKKVYSVRIRFPGSEIRRGS